MPDVLVATDWVDIANQTLPHLNRGRMSQMAQEFTNYEVMGRIMRRERVSIGSGKDIEFQVKYKQTGAARNVGLMDEDVINIVDTGTIGRAPWRNTNVPVAFNEVTLQMNGGAAQIFDYMESHEFDSMLSLTAKQEENWWGKPVDSNDDLTPWGIDMWITWAAGTAGFIGGNPSGFPNGAASLDVAAVDNWKNWAFTYTDVTEPDLIDKMHEAKLRTNFQSPIPFSDFRFGNGDRYRIYVNIRTYRQLKRLRDSRNENLGNDLAPGDINFMGNPVIYVPALDADTTDPVYMVDWGSMQLHFLQNRFMRRSPVIRAANKHNVFAWWIDNTWNPVCVNRRQNSVGRKAA